MSTFFSTYWPWIVTALIPTLITGLSLSPKTAPEAAWLQKALDYLKKVLSVFSVATFKDQVGTFKLPLFLDKIIKKVPPSAVILAIFLGASLSCAGVQKDIKTAAGVVATCSGSAAKQTASGLVPVIEAAAQQDGDILTNVVEGLLKVFTGDVVACSVKDAKADLIAKLPAGKSMDAASPSEFKAVAAPNKLAKLIRDKQWSYKE